MRSERAIYVRPGQRPGAGVEREINPVRDLNREFFLVLRLLSNTRLPLCLNQTLRRLF